MSSDKTSTEPLRCAVCGKPFQATDRMTDVGEGPQEIIVHDRCVPTSRHEAS